ncbi:Oligouridylate-binding protein 1C [Vitis vinifera]|uniref:Oligouridylate-binding protein 1C n=1 Tax=Vitis vinifera TaxID=29760 RepID=A0A438EDQ5_VITVI|nr:Oligouridylate-binding protein 1C [Vitis vinifera]
MTDEVAGWRLGGLQGFSGEEFQREKNRKEAAGGWVVFQRYFGRAEGFIGIGGGFKAFEAEQRFTGEGYSQSLYDDGHLFKQPIKVNWAYASGQREGTSGHFNIFVGDLSLEGYVGSEDWAFKRVWICFFPQSARCPDAKGVVELTNGSSGNGKETATDEAPDNNPQYTTVCVLQRYNTHIETSLAIWMGNTQSILCGKPIMCSWGSKPTPPGTSSNPLLLSAAAPLPSLSATDLRAYERQLAMSKMGGVHALMHPQGQHPFKQATMRMGCH